LTEFVPDSLNATVIATCRSSADIPSGWSSIAVGRMTEDESNDMVARTMPKLSPKDVSQLAASCQGYPLAIKYACTLLRYGTLTVPEFIEVFHANRRDFIVRASSDRGELLTEVMRSLAGLVRVRSDSAAHLLECIGAIARLGGDSVDLPHEFLSGCLSTLKGENPADRTLTVSYLSALQILREFGFIEREELGCIQTHPLIAEVLASMAEENFADIAACLMETYAALLPPGLESSPYGSLRYRSYSEAVIRRMGHELAKKIAYMHINRVMARAANVVPFDENNYPSFLTIAQIRNFLEGAIEDHRRDPKITWRTGRLAYNLIAGKGARLEFLLEEDQLISSLQRFIPPLSALRERFARELELQEDSQNSWTLYYGP
jgi:hypothetical protein